MQLQLRIMAKLRVFISLKFHVNFLFFFYKRNSSQLIYLLFQIAFVPTISEGKKSIAKPTAFKRTLFLPSTNWVVLFHPFISLTLFLTKLKSLLVQKAENKHTTKIYVPWNNIGNIYCEDY